MMRRAITGTKLIMIDSNIAHSQLTGCD